MVASFVSAIADVQNQNIWNALGVNAQIYRFWSVDFASRFQALRSRSRSQLGQLHTPGAP